MLLHAFTGRGSYGSVHKARSVDTNDIVAVKIIPLGDQDEISDIQKEIEMLQACDHPNIVQYMVRTNITNATNCQSLLRI